MIMKKDYVSPKVRVIELESKDQILADSDYTDFGGNTDDYD